MNGDDPVARPSTRSRVPLQFLSLALLCLLAYYDVPGYYFVGGDTFPIIESARLRSASDLYRILTEPLMSGTSFLELGVFYRPVSVLSFSLDHALWGLDHRGYNTTGLLIHLANALLLLLLLRRLTTGNPSASWIGAALFAIHPVPAEVVRSTDYRQDSLAAALLLISTLLFLRWHADRRPLPLVASLLFFFLSLGAKESTVILAGLIAVIAAVVPGATSSRSRFSTAIGAALPYLGVAAAWIAWRSYVIGGIGGYLESAEGFVKRLSITIAIIVAYFIDFISPTVVDILESSLRSMGLVVGTVIVLGLPLIFAILAAIWWKLFQAMARARARNGQTTDHAFAITTAGALLALPLYAPLLLFAHRLMYLPTLFFCGALGIALAASLSTLRRICSAWKNNDVDTRTRPRLEVLSWLGIAGILTVTTLAIIAGSPLLHKRNKLRLAGEVARTFIADVEVALLERGTAGGINLCVHNTARLGRHPTVTAENPGSLPRYVTRALESWLRLRFPDESISIFFQDGGTARPDWGPPRSRFPLSLGGIIVVYVPEGNCL